jgi:hypothetical protein
VRVTAFIGNKLQLQSIYSWFEANTDKARDPNAKGWQNSIRLVTSSRAWRETVCCLNRHCWTRSSERLRGVVGRDPRLVTFSTFACLQGPVIQLSSVRSSSAPSRLPAASQGGGDRRAVGIKMSTWIPNEILRQGTQTVLAIRCLQGPVIQLSSVRSSSAPSRLPAVATF